MGKKTFWIFLTILSASLGSSVMFSIWVIFAYFHNWQILLTFNEFNEGLFELIFIPILSLSSLGVLLYLFANYKFVKNSIGELK